MDDLFTSAFLTGLIAATLRMATPILFAMLGELISERAGVLNLGIEGTMVMGAMVGFLTTLTTGSLVLGSPPARGRACSSPCSWRCSRFTWA